MYDVNFDSAVSSKNSDIWLVISGKLVYTHKWLDMSGSVPPESLRTS